MKSGQYFDGTTWQQFGLSTSDYTLVGDLIANTFISCKDSNDNIYILCGTNTNTNNHAKIIKINNLGVIVGKSDITHDWYTSCYMQNQSIMMSRDNQSVWFTTGNGNGCSLVEADVSLIESSSPITTYVFGLPATASYASKFAIYKDLYIWVAIDDDVKIYDYTTKAELASASINTFFTIGVGSSGDRIDAISLSNNGTDIYLAMNLYATENRTVIGGLRYEAGGTWSKLFETILSTEASPKQLLIDPLGDIIILTNSGTASTLLKYTTAGVQVGTTLNLADPSYNLAIDTNGNYYYQTVFATFKIDKNTAQGQAFTGVGTQIRGSGNVGFGSNMTGAQPSVYA